MGFLIAVLLLLGSILILNRVLPGLLAGILFLTVQMQLSNGNLHPMLPVLGNSVLITLELGFLILGTYCFYILLQRHGHFEHLGEKLQLNYGATSLLMLLGWFLVGFFEGIAGFGIPALLIAPLLINVGYKPVSSIVLALSANTLSVCFGALGTPIKIGLGINQAGGEVIHHIRMMLLPMLVLMPVWLLFLAAKLEPVLHSFSIRVVLKGLLAGLLFAIPLYVASLFLVEFPSVIGGACGFIGFLILQTKTGQRNEQLLFWYHFFKPYLVLLAFLLLLRMGIGNASMKWHPDLRSISVYQPGIIVLLFTLFWSLTKGHPQKDGITFIPVIRAGWQKISNSLIIILFLVLFANLLRQPIQAFLADLQPMPALIPGLAAVSGVMGSFVSGSLTMSNLMLADAFRSITENESLLAVYLAILHIGGALGNAISLQNILVVNAVMTEPCPVRSVVGLNSLTVGLSLILLVVLGYGLW